MSIYLEIPSIWLIKLLTMLTQRALHKFCKPAKQYSYRNQNSLVNVRENDVVCKTDLKHIKRFTHKCNI